MSGIIGLPNEHILYTADGDSSMGSLGYDSWQTLKPSRLITSAPGPVHPDAVAHVERLIQQVGHEAALGQGLIEELRRLRGESTTSIEVLAENAGAAVLSIVANPALPDVKSEEVAA